MAPQRSLVCESCVAGIDEACARRANFRRGAANGYSVLADMVSDDEEQAGTEGASPTECEDGDGASAADELKTFDVYPLSEREPLEQTGRDVRVLHIVRHAEGTHNVNRAYREIENLDARLTPFGEEQCRQLASTCMSSHGLLEQAELVVTSPMTRCVQTALQSFPTLAESTHVEFLAHEGVRETVNYICDRRRSIAEIAAEFPRVNFSLIPHDHDEVWRTYEQRLGPASEFTKNRESAELHVVAERGRAFLDWLRSRPEKNVIVSTHSAFLRCFLNWGQPRQPPPPQPGERQQGWTQAEGWPGSVPFAPPQELDQRPPSARDVAVVRYAGEKPADLEQFMRRDYANCELRSFLVAFGHQKPE